jgi:hypothetical protein
MNYFEFSIGINLPNIGIVAEIKKHVADPNTVAMKIVRRNMKNCPTLLCKPVIE